MSIATYFAKLNRYLDELHNFNYYPIRKCGKNDSVQARYLELVQQKEEREKLI